MTLHLRDIKLPDDIYEILIEFTLHNYPNECCGLLFKNNTVFVPLNPEIQTPTYFQFLDIIVIKDIVEENGWPSGFFHSHPCVPYPSYTDQTYMQFMKTWAKAYDKEQIPWLILGNDFTYMSWLLGE